MNPARRARPIKETHLQLDDGDHPLTVHEHLMVEETARQLYIDLNGLRSSTLADNLAIACDAYRKALDLLVVARMFDRLHPTSAPDFPCLD